MTGVLHPRLRNAHGMKPADWTPQHVYVGRGMRAHQCPCRTKGCNHAVGLGNPYSVAADGSAVPVLFHAMLRNSRGLQARVRDVCVAPAILVCWCDGELAWCHGESYARFADGEAAESIEADVLARFK